MDRDCGRPVRVSDGTAKAYYEHEGLPVIIRRGKTPQTTKAALKVWAEGSDFQEDCS